MKKHRLSEQELEEIINLARLAPSVHNAQPWKVKAQGEGLEIIVDKKHALEAGDPTGRQTIISLGIFAEAVSLAAGSAGLKTDLKFMSDKIRAEFVRQEKTSGNYAELIKRRATDRSIYKQMGITETIKTAVQDCATAKSVHVWLIEDKDFLQKLAEFTAKSVSLALSNPQFREELARYLIRAGSRKKRGISVKSLYIPSVVANLQPELLKLGVSLGKEAELEKKRWLSASAAVLITTDGDLHDDWFNAGRSYLRASLEIERQGLSQATSAATVEAATFHEDVEELLGTNQRLQAVLRIGRGAEKRHYSPRVTTNELIT